MERPRTPEEDEPFQRAYWLWTGAAGVVVLWASVTIALTVHCVRLALR